jgi:glucose/arabinose dehydrogenase
MAVAVGAFAQDPGERIRIDAAALPPPGETPSASNPPGYVSRPDGFRLRVPAGFAAGSFAEGLEHPRWLAIAPNGDVFVAEAQPGRITVLRDADGDGAAETRSTFLAGLASPHGMVFHGDWLYVADTEAVWRVRYGSGQLEASGAKERVTAPGALGSGRGHRSRILAIHPDGTRLYVAIGSSANIAEEPEPRASVREFLIEGTGARSFATGLRNPVGLAFRPGTNELWTVVNERDGMGEELVPDYLTMLQDGGFYGWPYAYIGSNPQPGFAERRPDLVAKSLRPDLLFRSHSAPLGLVFYDGESFPAEYRGDAFVALHGSWNAVEPRGYFVARVPFIDGRPAGYYEVFASGFLAGYKESSIIDDIRAVFIGGAWASALRTLIYDLTHGTQTRTPALLRGRPAGLAIAKDGSLLIADDAAGAVWRVSFRR